MNNLSGLSNDELYLESIVDKIKSVGTLEGIGILRKELKKCFEASRELTEWAGEHEYTYETFENYLEDGTD